LRDVALSQKSPYLKELKTIAWHQSLSTGGDNWSDETYNCTHFTAAGHYAMDRELLKN
jgi:hypothetical protein